MKRWEHNLYLKKLREAIDAFDLIQPGDRLLVGVSGGKDSTLLWHGLSLLSHHQIYDFEVTGLTVDHGMLGNQEVFYQYFNKALYTHVIHQEHYADHLMTSQTSPCYTCSRLRKGIIKRYAQENGYQKIAFGHTADDLVETFLMNILKHGKMASIPARVEEEDHDIAMIRPLIYVDEKSIKEAVKRYAFPLMHDQCVFAKKRLREQSEELVEWIEKKAPSFSQQVIEALHHVEADRLLLKTPKTKK